MNKEVSAQRGRGGYLEALLTSCPYAILATDAEGTITFANREACKLAEREIHELVGKSIVTIYESLEAAKETNRKLYMNNGIIRDHDSRVKTKTGKIIPVRIAAAHMHDSSGKYIGAVGYFETYRPWTAEEAKIKVHCDELEAELRAQKDLGAPVFELYPGLAVVLVIGPLDMNRFDRINENLMNHLKSNKTRVVFFDLAAAVIADDKVAGTLLRTIRAVHLLGAECILGGIQPFLAQSMEPLLADVSAIKSYSDVGTALEAALNRIGFEICKQA